MEKRLTDVAVRKARKPGYLADGGGLYLQVSAARGGSDRVTKSWSFRFRDRGQPVTLPDGKVVGRLREMGLGPLARMTLAEVRKAAAACREMVARGIDPIAQRRAERHPKVPAPPPMTFRDAADRWMAFYLPTLRSAKTRAQTQFLLAEYTYPVIQDVPVADVTTGQITRILQPLWHGKAPSAAKLKSCVSRVLDFAIAHDWRTADNVARISGVKLGKQRAKTEHRPWLPWQNIPAFMEQLRQQDGVESAALELAILTACRTTETRHLHWGEVDFAQRVIILPAGKTKMDREHRIPLSDAAVDLLAKMQEIWQNDWVFPGRNKGASIGENALSNVLNKINPCIDGIYRWREAETGRKITVHGFRGSFSTWCSDTGRGDDHRLAEFALAHQSGSKVERSYQHSTLFDRRVALMQDWANYCAGHPAPSADVMPLNRVA